MTPIVYNKRIQFTTLEPHITQNVMFPSVGHEYGHTPSYGIPNKVSLGIKQAGINVNKHETHNKQPATRFIIPSNPYTFSSKISSSYILTLLALSIKAPICIDALHTAFGTRNLHDLTNSCSIDHAADMHVSLVEKLWKAGRLPVDLEQKKEDMDLDPDRGSLARAVSLGKEMKSYGGGPVGGRINVDGYVTGWARRRWEKEGSNQERKNREQIEMEKEKTEWKKLESKEADRKDKEQKEAPRKKAYRKEVERKVRERKETEQKELKGKKLGRKDIGEQDAESTEIEWQYHETQEMIRNEIDIKNEAMGYTEDRYSRRMELTRKAKIRRELDRRQLEWSIKFKDK
ncbi:hypothetical protein B0J11DRAFT_584346 [Dendryphion nanum]|uniref:Uncharacterized protein n=1 Tax=Dendryphion nanum TaxID=256645 RepID=A0A9P9D9R4_9PLEO|nr:hypothetical protein B0J11DRAFT_584346 [Dendryphion nanum]